MIKTTVSHLRPADIFTLRLSDGREITSSADSVRGLGGLMKISFRVGATRNFSNAWLRASHPIQIFALF